MICTGPKQMVKVSTQMSPLPQQLQSNLPRPIIRATSDPVQDFRQQAMNHEVLYQPDSGDIDGNDDNQCRGDGELSHHSSKIKRPRGRPKRRKARAAGEPYCDTVRRPYS